MKFWGQPSGPPGGVREPAVAGTFYPGQPERLAAGVDRYVAEAREALAARAAGSASGRSVSAGLRPDPDGGALVAVVVPHAGHVYSGPIAGFAYASIDPSVVERVILLGPAHYVPVDGIGVSTATAWRTPLGDVELDAEVAGELGARIDTVVVADAAHAPEHSLEVQVPFLQRVLPEGWRLVPLIVGADLSGDVAAVITMCAALPRTLVVVSTDLSHYLDYSSAIAQDARTIRSIVHRRPDSIGTSDACGRYPLRGLLTAAAAQDWSVRLLDARNSGDTAGDRGRVVGYAAFAVIGVSRDKGGIGARVDRSGDAPRCGGGGRCQGLGRIRTLVSAPRMTLSGSLPSRGRPFSGSPGRPSRRRCRPSGGPGSTPTGGPPPTQFCASREPPSSPCAPRAGTSWGASGRCPRASRSLPTSPSTRSTRRSVIRGSRP